MHTNYKMNPKHFSILGTPKTLKHQKYSEPDSGTVRLRVNLTGGHLRSTGRKTSWNASVDMHDKD